MAHPSRIQSFAIITNTYEDREVRMSKVGVGPLVSLSVHETGRGNRAIILDIDQATELVESLNDLLDEIEGKTTA